jgi:FdhD/NarQ family
VGNPPRQRFVITEGLPTGIAGLPQDSRARRWTNSKPNRPFTRRWPWLTSWSKGEVTFTIRLSCTCSSRLQPTPQYGQMVVVTVGLDPSLAACCLPRYVALRHLVTVWHVRTLAEGDGEKEGGPVSGRTVRRRVLRITLPGAAGRAAAAAARSDMLAAEEPLGIRVGGTALTMTMRTPGDDLELAAGFLVSEAVISSPADIAEIPGAIP